MTKVRVYELAKKLGVPSKKLMTILEDLDIDVKNHMSSLEDDMAQLIIDLINEEKEPKKNKKDKEEEKELKIIEPKKEVEKKEEQAKSKTQKVVLPEKITIKELGQKTNIEPVKLIKKLIDFGLMLNINADINFESAKRLLKEFGFEAEKEEEESKEKLVKKIKEESAGNLKPRPPVVTVMGHVDHGKTTLLDAIRETRVAAQEAGGITQHIGASQIEKDGKIIIFLDTPGHEAFTALRARGASVTDIVVLVVAADDGVMPQTIEAINHAKAAGVPIIVAVNKIDKPDANPEKVKQQLTEYGLIPEEWGGDTIFVNVSARNRIGIDQLLEMILLVADMQELKADYDSPAVGVIIEAKLDKGRGPVASVIVQKGTLKVGDIIVAGGTWGKVRAMFDSRGKIVKEATPSIPVEVIGFEEVPVAGDILKVVVDEKTAREMAEKEKELLKEKEDITSPKVSLEKLFDKIKKGEVKELNIIIKADVHGSLEALKQAIEKCSNDQVVIRIIHGGVGAINESDILLASASNAVVIGFNVRPDSNARKLAEKENIDIRTYRIIYELIEDLQSAMKGLLEPEYKEVVIGHAQVRALFKVPNVGIVAGCYVVDGKITRNANIRVIRNGVVIYEGKISSLKRFKDDVREVASGYECGIAIDKFNDIKEDDVLEAFVNKKVE
ncbi:Translation initiation factor IF-2 [Thermovenabulum gondwanense]|uniref:Translation initiation factor IF-2 n=2 Tax=Thermovenabulum gondwanense TaxID=520767 RepID=A0A162MG34_9FIRM|nr:translation initiation factor IF-2 [Thermovenabulum gondwanense]KYO65766.1 Translation initiation factor IF-2 [Thermovenabulum gondwanense]